MKKENGYTLVAITWGLLIFLCAGPVFADFGRGSTVVRERTSIDGSTYISDWCFGDIENQAGDGVLVTTVEVELVNFVGARHRWSLDIDWINANISVVAADIYAKVSATDTTTGYLQDKLTVSSGVITSTLIGGGGDEDLDLDIAIDGIIETLIDWGTGANQVDSGDVPNDTTNFDGNLSATDTNVLIALETIDEMPIGSGLLTYYLETTGSDIGGYLEMAPTYAADVARNSAAVIIADGTAIEEWITPLGQPNLTALSTGVYSMHIHAQQTAGTKTCTIYFELYKRAFGGAETLLATSEETPDVAGASTPYTMHASVTEQPLLATDRIVIKLIGNEGGAGTDPTAQIDYQALTLTRFEFPAQASALLPYNLDETCDEGHTAEYDPHPCVEWLAPDDSTPSVVNADNVINHYIRAREDTDQNADMLMLNWDADVTPGNAKFISFWQGNAAPAEVLWFLTDGSAYSVSTVTGEFALVTGDDDTAGQLLIADGSANYITIDVPAIGTDWTLTLPLDDGDNGEVLTTDGSGGTDWTAKTVDTHEYIDSISGTLAGNLAGGAFADQYMNLDAAATIPYAGASANDVVGFTLPFGASIVAISANYYLWDPIGVSTIDLFVREDGVNINAACKLTLAEVHLINRGSASVTFAPGTYTSVADQTLNIYADVTNGGAGNCTDVIVTVYYHYSL